MAWSWSHTAEAYESARQNLFGLGITELQEIHGEWFSYRPDSPDADSEGFDLDAHTDYHLSAPDLLADVLADDIWERMSEFATCDNGGFNAWCCPFGCHTVPFDRVDPSTELEEL